MNTVKGKENFYQRHGVTIRDARNLCIVLGLKPSTNIIFAADLLVVMGMKY